jgi:hypothetical protein
VMYAAEGLNGVMPIIKRINNTPYKWKVIPAPLSKIANVEKKLPASFIAKDGFGLTKKAKKYFQPLIEGRDKNTGKLYYAPGKMEMVKKKLKSWS